VLPTPFVIAPLERESSAGRLRVLLGARLKEVAVARSSSGSV